MVIVMLEIKRNHEILHVSKFLADVFQYCRYRDGNNLVLFRYSCCSIQIESVEGFNRLVEHSYEIIRALPLNGSIYIYDDYDVSEFFKNLLITYKSFNDDEKSKINWLEFFHNVILKRKNDILYKSLIKAKLDILCDELDGIDQYFTREFNRMKLTTEW